MFCWQCVCVSIDMFCIQHTTFYGFMECENKISNFKFHGIAKYSTWTLLHFQKVYYVPLLQSEKI
jgi:hypothetical protein